MTCSMIFFVCLHFLGLPGVLFVLPDSYVDVENKDYGGILLNAICKIFIFGHLEIGCFMFLYIGSLLFSFVREV